MSHAQTRHTSRASKQTVFRPGRKPWKVWTTVGGTVGFMLVVANASPYLRTIATTLGIWYLVAVALNLVVGYSGQFSAGHAAFFGMGAYAAALSEIHLGLSPVWSVIPAVLAGGISAWLVAVPLVRLHGPFIAMATFALQLAFTELALQWSPVTGGANGLLAPDTLSIGALEVGSMGLLILIALSGVLTFAVGRNFVSYRTGRALAAVEADRTLAQTLGVDVPAFRVLAFGLSGCICGLAGYWLLQYVLFIDPSAFDLGASITFLAVVVLGGRGTLTGPLVGVALYYASHTLLASFPTLEALLYGVLLVLVVRTAPRGIVGAIATAWHRLRGRSRREGGGGLDESVNSLHPEANAVVRLPSHLGGLGAVALPLSLEGVAKSFGGVKVLQDVSFDIRGSSEILALIGPNGAGKSTLLNIINGLDTADAGTIRIRDADLPSPASPERVARAGVARTFQVPRVAEDRSVAENVAMGAHLNVATSVLQDLISTPAVRRKETAIYNQVDQTLRWLGLSQMAGQPAGSLTHGHRRFVEIGRALMMRPTLLLLDEPGAGLEPEEIRRLGGILRSIKEDLGIPTLIVDHNMDLIMGLSDRVVVLHTGKIIAEGTPQEIQANPDVIDAYLGSLSGTGAVGG